MRFRLVALLAIAVSLLSGCGYNQIQINDESVTAAWSEVLNQYKRRADLIPNLVSVVQGYASHEKEVLTRVTEARANVAGLKATPELINDPEAFAKFQKAQGELGGALSRLLELRQRSGIVGVNLDLAHPRARIGDVGQHLAFLLGVALHGLHQIGDQVRTALVLVQDFRPAGLHRFVLLLDGVVAAARQQRDQHDEQPQTRHLTHGTALPWADVPIPAPCP